MLFIISGKFLIFTLYIDYKKKQLIFLIIVGAFLFLPNFPIGTFEISCIIFDDTYISLW